MNRLAKKCLIASAGLHLLLFVILLVGPAFLSKKIEVFQVVWPTVTLTGSELQPLCTP